MLMRGNGRDAFAPATERRGMLARENGRGTGRSEGRGMLIRPNGRHMYHASRPPCPQKDPVEQLDGKRLARTLGAEEWHRVLQRENELRLAPEAIEAHRALLGTRIQAQMQVADAIQRRVLAEFHVADIEHGLDLLRSCVARYPDEDFTKDAFYLRFNICHEGRLEAGSAAPDVPLADLDGRVCRLHERMPAGRPVVLVAGSGS